MLMPQPFEAAPRHDNVARATRRHKRKEYDVAAVSKSMNRQKPNTLRVKKGGDINGWYTWKNAWDDAVRSLIPRILDLNVIKWEGQKIVAIEKLQDALDGDFEYCSNDTQTMRFPERHQTLHEN
jgi:hypothetical protein